MDNRYYDKVVAEMSALFSEQGFVLADDGSYKNEKRAVKVEYDDAAQSYVLKMAEVSGDTVGEYAVLTSWLFDDSQTEADAETVGIDFCDTVRENIGAKLSKKVNAQIDLPTVSKTDAYNVTAFTKKMLDVFPEHKETYKAYVAKYENFLYLDFFGRYIVPAITGVYESGVKKDMKKLTDVFESGYIAGDKEAVNTMVAVLSAAVYKNDTARENLFASLGKNTHFINAIENFIPTLSKNARIRKMLIK